VLGRLTGRQPVSAGAERVVLVVAAVLFVAAFGFGLRAVPDGELHLTAWPLVVLALLAVPSANAANGLEYAVAARIGGHTVRVGEALEVSVLSSAANLLPLPGAALVRVRAMRRRGSSYQRALAVTALVGGAWLATSLVLAGGLLAAGRAGEVDDVAAAAVLGAGLVGVALVVVAVRRLAPVGQAPSLAAGLLAVEVLAVAVAAARYLLVLRALDLDVALEQAVALSVASVLASALGFVPGGLGLREALAGAIAGLVGLPVATGVLAAAVDRLVGLPVLAALSAGIVLRGGANRRR
jgi:hypothetical protein